MNCHFKIRSENKEMLPRIRSRKKQAEGRVCAKILKQKRTEHRPKKKRRRRRPCDCSIRSDGKGGDS